MPTIDQDWLNPAQIPPFFHIAENMFPRYPSLAAMPHSCPVNGETASALDVCSLLWQEHRLDFRFPGGRIEGPDVGGSRDSH